jgi:hypothetical protein
MPKDKDQAGSAEAPAREGGHMDGAYAWDA